MYILRFRKLCAHLLVHIVKCRIIVIDLALSAPLDFINAASCAITALTIASRVFSS
jgi:hypothetical protein